jgi:hypothetical protein
VSPQILGIYAIVASEPVHLVEIDLGDVGPQLDWSSITQPIDGRDKSFWQVPYDELPVPGTSGHWCFFFHYLDVNSPLRSNLGDLHLPAESPLPNHLRFIRYEEP